MPKDTITLEGSSGTTITNVADGDISATSSDAVNGSQLYATNQQVETNTTNITDLDGRVTTVEGDVVNLGDTITNIAGTTDMSYTDSHGLGIRYARTNEAGLLAGDSHAEGMGSTALGYEALASAEDAVALGRGAIASRVGSVAIGAGSVADGSTLGSVAYLVGGTATSEVNIGGRRITGVSAGAIDTDAVNVSQLKAVTTSVDDLGDRAVRYDGAVGDAEGHHHARGKLRHDHHQCCRRRHQRHVKRRGQRLAALRHQPAGRNRTPLTSRTWMAA